MKIMFAVHTYYPDKNGVQMVTEYMAEGLAKRHEVLVVTEKKGYADTESYRNVSIERIYVSKRGFRFIGEKDIFIEKIKDYAPDVLICVCTQSWTFDWLWGQIDKLPCKKVLYTHGYSALLKKYPLFKDLLHGRLHAFYYHFYWMYYYKRAWRLMKKFQLVTHLSVNNISVWYQGKHNLRNGMILENAVEDIFFELGGEKRNDTICYIYIANYDDNKNQKLVLEAFADANIKNTKLILAGSGEITYYQQLRKLLEKIKESNSALRVEILYGVSREQVYEIYNQAHVFICGSKKEQYPIMLCEAAAAGLAVISTRVGHAETMPGIKLVETRKEMADAISLFGCKKEERIESGEKMRLYAKEHFQKKDKIDEFEKALLQLLE